jgi:hypothetical protein
MSNDQEPMPKESPMTNAQEPMPKEGPMTKSQLPNHSLALRAWAFFGHWDLVIGHSSAERS